MWGSALCSLLVLWLNKDIDMCTSPLCSKVSAHAKRLALSYVGTCMQALCSMVGRSLNEDADARPSASCSQVSTH
jgi:hypothetical protein